MRFVSSLTQKEQEGLRPLVHDSTNHRERMRAQAILWSDKGYKLKQIADLCEVDRDTVSKWLRRWEQDRPSGLKDASRSGRPATLSLQEKKDY
ncbi:MAG: helix-turn-helix domain-containing protein [Bacteroidota bacterium]